MAGLLLPGGAIMGVTVVVAASLVHLGPCKRRRRGQRRRGGLERREGGAEK